MENLVKALSESNWIIGLGNLIFLIGLALLVYWIGGLAIWGKPAEEDSDKISYKQRKNGITFGFFLVVLGISILAIAHSSSFTLPSKDKQNRANNDNEVTLQTEDTYIHKDTNFKFRVRNLYKGDKISYEYMAPDKDEWIKLAGPCDEAKVNFTHKNKQYLFSVLECFSVEGKILCKIVSRDH